MKKYMWKDHRITKLDISFDAYGMTIKLLAIYRKYNDGVDLHVSTLINNSHLLAAVSNELNANTLKAICRRAQCFMVRELVNGLPHGVSDIVDLSRDLLLKEGEKYCNRAISLTCQILP